jgi:hypothetical protein
MSNDEREIENLPVRTDYGFDDSDDNDRLLQGTRAVCIDGEWTRASDETKIPPDKRFLALGTAEGLQHWEDGQLVEERIKKPNETLPKVDELNAEIPQDTWEEGHNGPRPPWSYNFAVYLLDLDDGSIWTHLNSTNGAAKATRQLKEQVKWKRALLGGRKVLPTVTLGKQLVSRQFKKIGPAFVVIPDGWRDLGSALPEQTAPRQLEDQTEKETLNDSVADISRPVVEPTMEELLGDKIPEDDWQPPGEPAAKATPDKGATKVPKGAVLESVTTSASGILRMFRGYNIDLRASGHWVVSKDGKELHRADNEGAARTWVNEFLLKEKPQITKRGAQKIAGSRGR